jgi:hypothetical protein
MTKAVFWNVAPCIYIVLTDVSEERIACVFRVEKKEENPLVRNQREQVLTEDCFLHSHNNVTQWGDPDAVQTLDPGSTRTSLIKKSWRSCSRETAIIVSRTQSTL